MAVVRIDDPAGRRYPVWEVCARCGAAATTWKDKTFAWHPPWVWVLLLAGLLPFAIVALILTKRMRVRMPLCEDHQNHWLWRNIIVFGGLFAWLGLAFLAFVSMTMVQWGNVLDDLGGLLCVGTVLGLLAWFVVTIVLSGSAIRPVGITDYAITLTGVAPEFADAVRDERRHYARDIETETERYWRQRQGRSSRDEYEDKEERERYRRRDERIEPE
jgi:hypothetical protein